MSSTTMRFSRSHEAQLQFLRESARLEESVAPAHMRRTGLALSLVVLALVGWAAFATIDEIAQAPGEIVPIGFPQMVQHFDGGIVKEIPVLEGTFVKEGDTPMVLDGAGTEEELKKAVIALNSLAYVVETSKELFHMQEELEAKGVASKVRFLEAKQALSKAIAQLDQQQQVVAALRDRQRRLRVLSPVTGLVKGLKVNTIGAVIKPGEPLMEIVPTSKTLVVEARLSPSDIGNVQVGQDVKVKISSFDYGRYGTIDGTVQLITATTFADDVGKKYYRTRITLKHDYVGNHPTMKVRPGMTVVAGIITGRKTVLEYLMKPVQRALENAMSER